MSMLKSGKYWLCVQSLRVNFQTLSIGLRSGLYGGRNNSPMLSRYFFNQGWSSTAWWYRALSNIMTILLFLVLRFINLARNSPKVTALKTEDVMCRNFPDWIFTAPNNAMLFRVGACITVGSLSSGGIHMAHLDPCCWKWHSSRLHISICLTPCVL